MIAHHHIVSRDANISATLSPLLMTSVYAANNNVARPTGEAGDFALPLVHQRRGTNDADALDLAYAFQQNRSSNRLHGFSQAHFIGNNRASSIRGEPRTSALVRRQFRAQ